MIIETRDGRRIDTASELSAAERHVLQKLLNWRDLATSLEQFRDKAALAFERGWGGRGPLRPSPTFSAIVVELEAQLGERLARPDSDHRM